MLHDDFPLRHYQQDLSGLSTITLRPARAQLHEVEHGLLDGDRQQVAHFVPQG